MLAAIVNVTVGPGLSYSPDPVTLNSGDTVQWNWAGGVAHSSTSLTHTQTEYWDSGVKSAGSFTHTFTNSGSWGYFCTVHGTSMRGPVQVSAAVTAVVPALSPRALVFLGLTLAFFGVIAVRRA